MDEFKTCPLCQRRWNERADFLNDLELQLVGYEANFRRLEAGWFLFNHNGSGCGTTLAVEAGKFFDLYTGPVFQERKTGSDECPKYCLRQSELARCLSRCECAFVREIVNMILSRDYESDFPSRP